MYEIRSLVKSDLDAIKLVQFKVINTVERKDIFQTSTDDFILNALGKEGICFGAFHNKELVAYRIVFFPGDSEKNLANDLPSCSFKKHHIAHWDTVAVLPDHRGNNLSQSLSKKALGAIGRLGFEHILSTSSPYNFYGVRSLTRMRFRAIAWREKYGGKDRFILHRPVRVINSDELSETSFKCDFDNKDEIKSYLERGCSIYDLSISEGIKFAHFVMTSPLSP